MIRSSCYLCGSMNLEELTLPLTQSPTTDGKTIPVKPITTQCLNCGLMQKLQNVATIFTHLSYSENYRLYDRPGVRDFDRARYNQYAEWIGRFILPSDSHILEIGCGSGWTLEILGQSNGHLKILGLEPAKSACERAIARGTPVIQGMAGDKNLSLKSGAFDIVYTINVLEHIPDPIGFLKDITALLKPSGRLITICPNSDVISSESLYIDHLFSITSANLRTMYHRAGINCIHWEVGPNPGMDDLHLMTGTLDKIETQDSNFKVAENLVNARRDYYASWSRLDDVLMERLSGAEDVVCFGAGETSDLISLMAPRVWNKVRAYAIDRIAEQAEQVYRSLPLYFLDEVPRESTMLLGVKQHYQDALFKRLITEFSHVVRWDDAVRV